MFGPKEAAAPPPYQQRSLPLDRVPMYGSYKTGLGCRRRSSRKLGSLNCGVINGKMHRTNILTEQGISLVSFFGCISTDITRPSDRSLKDTNVITRTGNPLRKIKRICHGIPRSRGLDLSNSLFRPKLQRKREHRICVRLGKFIILAPQCCGQRHCIAIRILKRNIRRKRKRDRRIYVARIRKACKLKGLRAVLSNGSGNERIFRRRKLIRRNIKIG